jgi:hypothetical protein
MLAPFTGRAPDGAPLPAAPIPWIGQPTAGQRSNPPGQAPGPGLAGQPPSPPASQAASAPAGSGVPGDAHYPALPVCRPWACSPGGRPGAALSGRLPAAWCRSPVIGKSRDARRPIDHDPRVASISVDSAKGGPFPQPPWPRVAECRIRPLFACAVPVAAVGSSLSWHPLGAGLRRGVGPGREVRCARKMTRSE